FSENQFNDIFTNEVVASIKSYVEAGGNLLLTKQAARLAFRTGRIGYSNNWSDAGYADGGDTWYIKTKLGGGTANPTDRSGHAIYKDIAKDENGRFPLVGAVKRSDRNTPWQDYMRKDGAGDTHYDNTNVQRLSDFESDWKCQALATWPHINDYCYPMVIDFLPDYGDFQGGMLAICLAAYQWGTGNYDADPAKGYIANVQQLTKNSIEYLYGSDPRPQVEASWNVTPVGGVIGGSMTASVTTEGTVSWSSSDDDVASVSNAGVISYNGFGTCTITATVSKDGNADANLSQSITVTGGAAAAYAYALPYSFYTMQHYDNEEGYYPDYQAAKWFYDNYVAHGTGCFIKPTDYSSSSAISSAVKVLWVNNDHVGLSKESYYTDLGGNNFKDALVAFSARGGNIYLSKQACYWAFKMGKIYEPSWGDRGYSDANADEWPINAGYIGYALAESCRKDRSSHPIFKGMTTSAANTISYNDGGATIPYVTYKLVGLTRRTENNFMWTEMDYNMSGDHKNNDDTSKLSDFESEWNCQVLAVWGHVQDFCGAGLIEFFPTATTGTIIANGFAAYQWGTNNSDDSDETAISNVKKLTQNALEYLYSVDTYTRSGLTKDQYGTICLPRASAALEGATFFKVLGKEMSGETPLGVHIEEVDALEAGKPYIFEASAEEISVTYTGAAVSAPDNSESNGLIGSFYRTQIPDNETESDFRCILKDNGIYKVNHSYVGANRAYFDLETMEEYDDSRPVMGRRRFMGIDRPSMPTDVENAEAAKIESRKVIENGQLFIIKNGVKYNAQGQIVK
ncbi:MAG: DUF4960 domain-containing protein, partial [Paludibacteraceae bacterium]|nr:DUF4960 domain-containing protein [Paludibacteraceae bacterium]